MCNKHSKVCHISVLKVPQSNEWMEYWELEWVMLLLESKTISHIFPPHTHNGRETCLGSKNVTYLTQELRDSENLKYELAGGKALSNSPGQSSGKGEQKGGKYLVGPWIRPWATFFSLSKSIFYTCAFFKVCSRKTPRLTASTPNKS